MNKFTNEEPSTKGDDTMAMNKKADNDLTAVHLVSMLGYLLKIMDDPSMVPTAKKGAYDQFKVVYEDAQGRCYLFQNVLISK